MLGPYTNHRRVVFRGWDDEPDESLSHYLRAAVREWWPTNYRERNGGFRPARRARYQSSHRS